jgi:hypothetical protein
MKHGVLFEKLIVANLFNKLPVFYGIWRFIITFRGTCRWTLPESAEQTYAPFLKYDAMIALMMEVVRTSETSVYSNETKRRYIPQHSKRHFVVNMSFF